MSGFKLNEKGFEYAVDKAYQIFQEKSINQKVKDDATRLLGEGEAHVDSEVTLNSYSKKEVLEVLLESGQDITEQDKQLLAESIHEVFNEIENKNVKIGLKDITSYLFSKSVARDVGYSLELALLQPFAGALPIPWQKKLEERFEGYSIKNAVVSNTIINIVAYSFGTAYLISEMGLRPDRFYVAFGTTVWCYMVIGFCKNIDLSNPNASLYGESLRIFPWIYNKFKKSKDSLCLKAKEHKVKKLLAE